MGVTAIDAPVIVVMHWTIHDARRAARFYRAMGFEVAEVVSPRTLDARLRGVSADHAFMCGGTQLDAALCARVVEAMKPCQATRARQR